MQLKEEEKKNKSNNYKSYILREDEVIYRHFPPSL